MCPQCGQQIGWMFEPEDSALAGLERPGEQGFIAVIVSKAGDVTRVDRHSLMVSRQPYILLTSNGLYR